MDNNTAYDKIPDGKLRDELKFAVDRRIGTIYEKIRAKILEHASKGFTKMKIYIPKTESSFTYSIYHEKIIGIHQGFTDDFFVKNLLKKFKNDGIYVEIYSVYEKYELHIQLLKYSGVMIKCKWNRDYSKNSCILV